MTKQDVQTTQLRQRCQINHWECQTCHLEINGKQAILSPFLVRWYNLVLIGTKNLIQVFKQMYAETDSQNKWK